MESLYVLDFIPWHNKVSYEGLVYPGCILTLLSLYRLLGNLWIAELDFKSTWTAYIAGGVVESQTSSRKYQNSLRKSLFL
jgi:hypothetical protein